MNKNTLKEYKTGSGFITPYGERKFFRGQGLKKDRNVNTWEDKKQDAYLKAIEKAKEK
jgi:hypothetical protein